MTQRQNDSSGLLAVQIKLRISEYFEVILIVKAVLNELLTSISLYIFKGLRSEILVEYLLQLDYDRVVDPVVRELLSNQHGYLA